MRPQERDELAKHQKLEAINAELVRHKRMARVALLLVVVLNAVLLALLAYHLLSHGGEGQLFTSATGTNRSFTLSIHYFDGA